jgi:hypothetical protein
MSARIMDMLASLFVGKPLHILLVAGLFLAAYSVLRYRPVGVGKRRRPILVAAITWVLYAGWEWLVQARTPEANIRVDLMVIWPLLATVTAWALIALQRRRAL